MRLEKYTMGCGDRFAREASAQLAAYEKTAAEGRIVVPVWNKSNREHDIVGSEPPSVGKAAKAAVTAANWTHGWHVDADHIGLKTVDRYLESSDFFTMDVADGIGGDVDDSDVAYFLKKRSNLVGESVDIAGLPEPIVIPRDNAEQIVRKYLPAVKTAGADLPAHP